MPQWLPGLVAVRVFICPECRGQLVDNLYCKFCKEVYGLQEAILQYFCPTCNVQGWERPDGGFGCPRCKHRLNKPS